MNIFRWYSRASKLCFQSVIENRSKWVFGIWLENWSPTRGLLQKLTLNRKDNFRMKFEVWRFLLCLFPPWRCLLKHLILSYLCAMPHPSISSIFSDRGDIPAWRFQVLLLSLLSPTTQSCGELLSWQYHSLKTPLSTDYAGCRWWKPQRNVSPCVPPSVSSIPILFSALPSCELFFPHLRTGNETLKFKAGYCSFWREIYF